ncbi:hypothetical protein WNZ14_15805 [Hoeflea sp. AS60]|uniref:hypothetical protein n=1 Tax=Hoeflea sp. AS60 TaxID=3135780 RepID=UPI00316DE62C
MFRTMSKVLLVLACLVPVMPPAAFAQEATPLAESLSPRILFVTSGGYWEKDEDATASSEASSEKQRGYYRLVAIRGEDNRSLVELQQIALTPAGPAIATSTGVEALNSLGGYVTDIRPEDSTGASSQPGFAAYIYIKTDPSVIEPETWALLIDEFGDIQVEKSSN